MMSGLSKTFNFVHECGKDCENFSGRIEFLAIDTNCAKLCLQSRKNLYQGMTFPLWFMFEPGDRSRLFICNHLSFDEMTK